MNKVLRISILAALLGVSAPALAQVEIGVTGGGSSGGGGGDSSSASSSTGVSTVGSSSARRGGGTVSVAGGQRYVPETHTVRQGDTLWDITGRYYGNPWDWPRVWSFNPEITNPHWIYPQDIVRLRGTQVAPELPQRTIIRRPRADRGTIWLRDRGYLDADALENSGTIVGSREDHMLLAQHDEAYVQFEEGETPQVGQVYTVYRNERRSDRPDDADGVLVRVLGSVRLLDYDEDRNIGRATIIEAIEPIERGYRIAQMERRFEMVPPRVNDRDLDATVVAQLRDLVFLADQQIGFIDKGTEDGVQLGNRFFIVREGDEWRDEQVYDQMDLGESVPDNIRPEEYPPEIVAEARVVHVRENSATIIVTGSLRGVRRGDRARMMRGF